MGCSDGAGWGIAYGLILGSRLDKVGVTRDLRSDHDSRGVTACALPGGEAGRSDPDAVAGGGGNVDIGGRGEREGKGVFPPRGVGTDSGDAPRLAGTSGWPGRGGKPDIPFGPVGSAPIRSGFGPLGGGLGGGDGRRLIGDLGFSCERKDDLDLEEMDEREMDREEFLPVRRMGRSSR